MDTETQGQGTSPAGTLRTKTAEMVVAVVTLLLGALVVGDSLRIGISWAAEGPEAGYFPFYIGSIICAASAWNLWTAARLRGEAARAVFASGREWRPVLAVLLPSAVFVAATAFIGIYVAAAVFIAAFMVWIGRIHYAISIATGMAVSVALFLAFERWFLVPLPKGPLEALLGY